MIPFSRLKAWYEGSPTWLKAAYAAVPFSLRMGRVYRHTQRLIEKTDFASREELDHMQAESLGRLIEHAYRHVPHYRQVMRQRGLGPNDIRCPADLAKMPLVSKSRMQLHIEQFAATGGLRERVFWDNTGGSSGTPFRFLALNSTYPVEMAYILAQWKRVGYSPRERRLTLRGRVVGAGHGEARWQYNPIYNELRASSYHIDADAIARLMPELKRFRPTFVYGYPSAVALFLRILDENHVEFPCRVKGVLCGSEPLFDYQRELIRRVLGCRAYSWYGQSERVLLAGECERTTAYHSFPLYGIAELVDDAGDPITTPGMEGEIVATSLHNLAMPFIRYRTGDRGVFDTNDTCICGRNHQRIKKVVGRTQDYVYTRAGRAVPVTAIVFGQHFRAFARMFAMQLAQDTPGEVTVRIVRGPEFTDADEKEIRDTMENAVDREIHVRVEYPKELSRTDSGKTPFVIQAIAKESLPPRSQ
ncbi:MAG: phenylacetate--CoA ligase family protein [Pirellulales bacterium]|nr:phenylacetate--CoA ligase family protein [Pirellulales bacterium]